MKRAEKCSFPWILFLLLLAGGALRIYDLGGKSLWYDEIYELHIAGRGIGYILKALHPLHCPLNQIIDHFFLLFGKSEFTLRLPSALWGVLNIWALYAVGNLFFGRKEGLIGAFLLTVSSYHIRYSQEGRMYTLLILTSLLSIYFFWRTLNDNRKRDWFGYILFSVFSLYTHLFALFVVLSQAVFVCLCRLSGFFPGRTDPWRGREKAFFLSLGFILTVLIPEFVPAVKEAFQPSNPWLVINVGSVSRAAGVGGIKVSGLTTFLNLYGAGPGLPLLVYPVLFLAGILSSLKKRRIQIGYLLLLILLPFCVFQFIKPSHIFNPRYLIFLLPAGYLVIAKGIIGLEQLGGLMVRSRGARRLYLILFYSLVTAFFVLLNVRPLQAYYVKGRDPEGRLIKLDWRGMARYLEENAQPGDAVIAGEPSPYYNMVCLRQYLSPELQARLSMIDPAQLKEAGVWRIGRGPREGLYPDGMQRIDLPPPPPGIGISYARGPVNLRRKKISPLSLEKGTEKIPVESGKRFFLSVWVKGAERHYERFSPYPSLLFYDFSSQPVSAPDRGMVLITDQEDGWKQYVLNGLIPAAAAYVQVCFRKYELHIGEEVVIDKVRFYGDW